MLSVRQGGPQGSWLLPVPGHSSRGSVMGASFQAGQGPPAEALAWTGHPGCLRAVQRSRRAGQARRSPGHRLTSTLPVEDRSMRPTQEERASCRRQDFWKACSSASSCCRVFRVCSSRSSSCAFSCSQKAQRWVGPSPDPIPPGQPLPGHPASP